MRGCAGRDSDQGGGGAGGVGTEGEPELRVLVDEGKPAAWTVGGAEGKQAKFGGDGLELAPKANPQRELWVVPKANLPSMVLEVEGVELASMVNQSSTCNGIQSRIQK